MKMTVFTTEQSDAWKGVLDQCAPYDFYHLPQYHVLAEQAGEGTAHLFVFTEGDSTIALPLLLRDLGPDLAAPGWRDATSVYGYAGPVCSPGEISDAVTRNFQAALVNKLREMRVVTVFSRLHPLLTQRSLLAGLGEYRLSQTVSIDLTLEPAAQRSKYRRAHKDAINKLRRLGLTVIHDLDGTYLEDFVRIYHETMHRVDAADWYFFSPAYFRNLWESLGSRIHLFVCLYQGRPVCGSLCVACHGIIQYHLGGTLNDAIKLAPMKLLLDEARLWGNSQGMRFLHMGGGMTSAPDDPLLHFKMGFSDRTHEFATWRWILCPEIYERLSASAAEWNQRHLMKPANADFFPAYRAPTVPCVSVHPVSPDIEPILGASRFSCRGTP